MKKKFFRVKNLSVNTWNRDQTSVLLSVPLAMLNTQQMTKSTLPYLVKMEYIWVKFLAWSYVYHTSVPAYPTKIFFFWNPSMRKKCQFVTELVFFCKGSTFYQVKWIRRKWLPRGRIQKKSRPLLTIIFRPKMSKFHPNSIWVKQVWISLPKRPIN